MINLKLIIILASVLSLVTSLTSDYKFYVNQPLQLLSLRTEALVEGSYAEIKYIHSYRNPFDLPLETEFYFPRTDNSIFYKFEAVFQNKTIVGFILEKEEARRIYQKNLEQGNTIAIAERSDLVPDIMKIKVGNIPPEESVEIQFSVIEPLDLIVNKYWGLKLPVVLTERYAPASVNPEEIPQVENVDIDDSVYQTWKIGVVVRSNSPFNYLKNPTHRLIPKIAEENSIGLGSRVYTASWNATVVPDKDFVIYFKSATLEEPTTVLAEYLYSPRDYVYHVNFVPQLNTLDTNTVETHLENGDEGVKELSNMVLRQDTKTAKVEFIFIIDRSFSMEGDRIANLKRALHKFFENLPQDSYFNIISFGDEYSLYRSESIKYTPASLQEVLDWIPSIQANLGGTEILAPIKLVTKIPLIEGYPRTIMLLTDGYVYNANEVIKNVLSNSYNMRFCTVGIGYGASEFLVKNVAKAGKCTSELLQDDEDVGEKTLYMIQAAISQHLENIEFRIECFNYEGVKVFIQDDRIGFLLKDHPFRKWVYLQNISNIESCEAYVKYYNSLSGEWVKKEFSVTDFSSAEKSERWHQIAYDAKIRELDLKINSGYNTEKLQARIVELSTKYQILSDYTAFLALIQENEIDPETGRLKIRIPNVNSADYNNDRNGGEGDNKEDASAGYNDQDGSEGDNDSDGSEGDNDQEGSEGDSDQDGSEGDSQYESYVEPDYEPNVEKVQYISNDSLELLEVKVETLIEGPYAKILYTYRYKNPHLFPIETEFKFPSTVVSLFDEFEAVIQGSVIRAIPSNDNQFFNYMQNLKRGNTSVLLSPGYGEIYPTNARLGYLHANETIEMRYSIIQPLELLLNNLWSLTLPPAIIPKDWSQNQDFGTKPYTVEIKSDSPFTYITSPSYQSEPILSKSSIAFASKPYSALWNIETTPNENFMAYFMTDNMHNPSFIFSEHPSYPDDYVFSVNFVPKLNNIELTTISNNLQNGGEGIRVLKEMSLNEGIESAKGEFLFVLDRTGSMEGSRIKDLRRVLLDLLDVLPSDSLFNLINFGETYFRYEAESMKYSSDSLEEVIEWMELMEADMDYGEILPVLDFARSLPTTEGYPRNIIILTHGDISQPDDTYRFIHSKESLQMRFSAVGIGNESSTGFISNVASYGKGTSEFVTDNENLGEERARSMIRAVTARYLKDLTFRVECLDNQRKQVFLQEEKLGFLLQGEPFKKWVYLENGANINVCNGQIGYYDSLGNGNKEGIEFVIDDFKRALESDIWHKIAYDTKAKEIDDQKEFGDNLISKEVLTMEKLNMLLSYGISSSESYLASIVQE